MAKVAQKLKKLEIDPPLIRRMREGFYCRIKIHKNTKTEVYIFASEKYIILHKLKRCMTEVTRTVKRAYEVPLFQFCPLFYTYAK